MATKKSDVFAKVLTALAFFMMVLVNFLATFLPINGVTPGEVSDSYPNLFAPAGITFAIWGLIYLLLFGFTLYQFGLFHKNKKEISPALMSKVRFYFILSSIANTCWIFAWHYKIIPLSLILIVIILICLILIANELKNAHLSLREYFFIKLPFSIYFGWITVATIANVTTLLVSLGWNGFGISQQIWAIIMIVVGAIIGILTILHNQDFAYGLVILWAYIGILLKHVSEKGFQGKYPAVITTVIVCLVVVAIVDVYILYNRSKQKA